MSLHFLTEEWVVSIGCLLGIFYGISKVDRLDPESPASKTVDGSEIPNNLPPGVMLKTPYSTWDKLPIHRCRISAINSCFWGSLLKV